MSYQPLSLTANCIVKNKHYWTKSNTQ